MTVQCYVCSVAERKEPRGSLNCTGSLGSHAPPWGILCVNAVKIEDRSSVTCRQQRNRPRASKSLWKVLHCYTLPGPRSRPCRLPSCQRERVSASSSFAKVCCRTGAFHLQSRTGCLRIASRPLAWSPWSLRASRNPITTTSSLSNLNVSGKPWLE